MYLLLLFLIGISLFSLFFLYSRTSKEYGSIKYYYVNKQIEVFFLFSIGFLFIIFCTFQYIDTSPSVRWINGGISNDMSRYKIAFDSIKNKSLKESFFSLGQEPLYVLYVYVLSRITSHFSVVLLVTYIFMLLSIYSFIKHFFTNKSFFLLCSTFIFIYTLVLTSFCLFRMGIALSFMYLAYIRMAKKKMLKSLVYIIIACGFHISAIYGFFVYVLYAYSEKNEIKKFLFLFFFLFFVEFFCAKLLNIILPRFIPGKAVYLTGGIAKSTYLTNFLFILLLIPDVKRLYSDSSNRLLLIVFLASFYILPLQMVVSVFYRMIFYTYVGNIFVINCINKRYNKRSKFFSSFCVKSFLVFYLFIYLYKFYTNAWISYGLNTFKLFYFY